MGKIQLPKGATLIQEEPQQKPDSNGLKLPEGAVLLTQDVKKKDSGINYGLPKEYQSNLDLKSSSGETKQDESSTTSSIYKSAIDLINTHLPVSADPVKAAIRKDANNAIASDNTEQLVKTQNLILNNYQKELNNIQEQKQISNFYATPKIPIPNDLKKQIDIQNELHENEIKKNLESAKTVFKTLVVSSIVNNKNYQGSIAAETNPNSKSKLDVSPIAKDIGKEIDKYYPIQRNTGNKDYDLSQAGLDALKETYQLQANDLYKKGVDNKNPQLIEQAKQKQSIVDTYANVSDNLFDKFPDVAIEKTKEFLTPTLRELFPNKRFYTTDEVTHAVDVLDAKYGGFKDKMGKYIGEVEKTGIKDRSNDIVDIIFTGIGKGGQQMAEDKGSIVNWLTGDRVAKDMQQIKERNPDVYENVFSIDRPTKVVWDKEGKTYRDIPNENYGTLNFNSAVYNIASSIPSLIDFVAKAETGGEIAGVFTEGLSTASAAIRSASYAGEGLKYYELGGKTIAEGTKSFLGTSIAVMANDYDRSKKQIDELMPNASNFEKSVATFNLNTITAIAFGAIEFSPNDFIKSSFEKSIKDDVVKAIGKDGGISNADAQSLFKNVIAPKLNQVLKNVAKSYGTGAKVGLASVSAEKVKQMYEAYLNKDKAETTTSEQDLQEIVQSTLSLGTIGSFGGIISGLQSPSRRDALYAAGLEAPKYIEQINKAVVNGDMLQEEANKYILSLNQLNKDTYRAQELKNDDGLKLTQSQKQDVALENFRKHMAEHEIEKSNNEDVNKKIVEESNKKISEILRTNMHESLEDTHAFKTAKEVDENGNEISKPEDINSIKANSNYSYEHTGKEITTDGTELLLNIPNSQNHEEVERAKAEEAALAEAKIAASKDKEAESLNISSQLKSENNGKEKEKANAEGEGQNVVVPGQVETGTTSVQKEGSEGFESVPSFTGLSHIQSAAELLRLGKINETKHSELVDALNNGSEAEKDDAITFIRDEKTKAENEPVRTNTEKTKTEAKPQEPIPQGNAGSTANNESASKPSIEIIPTEKVDGENLQPQQTEVVEPTLSNKDNSVEKDNIEKERYERLKNGLNKGQRASLEYHQGDKIEKAKDLYRVLEGGDEEFKRINDIYDAKLSELEQPKKENTIVDNTQTENKISLPINADAKAFRESATRLREQGDEEGATALEKRADEIEKGIIPEQSGDTTSEVQKVDEDSSNPTQISLQRKALQKEVQDAFFKPTDGSKSIKDDVVLNNAVSTIAREAEQNGKSIEGQLKDTVNDWYNQAFDQNGNRRTDANGREISLNLSDEEQAMLGIHSLKLAQKIKDLKVDGGDLINAEVAKNLEYEQTRMQNLAGVVGESLGRSLRYLSQIYRFTNDGNFEVFRKTASSILGADIPMDEKEFEKFKEGLSSYQQRSADILHAALIKAKKITDEVRDRVVGSDELYKKWMNDEVKKRVSEALKKTKTESKGTKSKTEKKYSEKAKNVADKFRKLKTKPFTFKDENGNDIPIQIQGVSWSDLVELGAKVIEKTGEVADGISAIVDKIKDTDFYAKLSANDKQKFQEQLQQHYEGSIEETPEAKTIKRLEKQLEDLQTGNIKSKTEPLEDTPAIKELRDKIFNAKKELGLISSKKTASKSDELKITAEEKKIEHLEKEKADLESGIVKQTGTNNLKPTPEQKATIDKLNEDISDLKKNLGALKSKAEKPLSEQEKIEADENKTNDIVSKIKSFSKNENSNTLTNKTVSEGLVKDLFIHLGNIGIDVENIATEAAKILNDAGIETDANDLNEVYLGRGKYHFEKLDDINKGQKSVTRQITEHEKLTYDIEQLDKKIKEVNETGSLSLQRKDEKTAQLNKQKEEKYNQFEEALRNKGIKLERGSRQSREAKTEVINSHNESVSELGKKISGMLNDDAFGDLSESNKNFLRSIENKLKHTINAHELDSQLDTIRAKINTVLGDLFKDHAKKDRPEDGNLRNNKGLVEIQKLLKDINRDFSNNRQKKAEEIKLSEYKKRLISQKNEYIRKKAAGEFDDTKADVDLKKDTEAYDINTQMQKAKAEFAMAARKAKEMNSPAWVRVIRNTAELSRNLLISGVTYIQGKLALSAATRQLQYPSRLFSTGYAKLLGIDSPRNRLDANSFWRGFRETVLSKTEKQGKEILQKSSDKLAAANTKLNDAQNQYKEILKKNIGNEKSKEVLKYKTNELATAKAEYDVAALEHAVNDIYNHINPIDKGGRYLILSQGVTKEEAELGFLGKKENIRDYLSSPYDETLDTAGQAKEVNSRLKELPSKMQRAMRSALFYSKSLVRFHGVYKDIPARMEIVKGYMNRLKDAQEKGQDISNYQVKNKLWNDAVVFDGQDAKFQEKNSTADLIRAGYKGLGRLATSPFKSENVKEAADALASMATPVLKVPMNIFRNSMQYNFGLLMGGIKVLDIMVKARGEKISLRDYFNTKLTQEQRYSLVTTLGRGTAGAFMMAGAAMMMKNGTLIMGGQYPDPKKPPIKLSDGSMVELQYGDIVINGHLLPHWLSLAMGHLPQFSPAITGYYMQEDYERDGVNSKGTSVWNDVKESAMRITTEIPGLPIVRSENKYGEPTISLENPYTYLGYFGAVKDIERAVGADKDKAKDYQLTTAEHYYDNAGLLFLVPSQKEAKDRAKDEKAENIDDAGEIRRQFPYLYERKRH